MGRAPPSMGGSARCVLPDGSVDDAFGRAVTEAFRRGEDVELVLPHGRRRVIEIDDSQWFEGRGIWLAQ